jgi:D-alanine transaminase
MTASPIVYVNGGFESLERATVSLMDRGLLFGDGVYEVYRNYRGRPFRLKEHLDRLRRSAAEVRIPLAELDWLALHGELLERNALAEADSTVYIQLTRGAPASRGHAFPATGTPPTLFVMARPVKPVPEATYGEGVAVISRPDLRWGRCDIKSVNLLPNVLANQEAAEAGAWEAMFVRDGLVTEGTHTNVFVVLEGRVRTHPPGPRILGGVTRQAVLEVARGVGLAVEEAAVPRAALDGADEVFLTGTTAEVLAVATADGRSVGGGRPGPVAARLRAGLRELT